MTNFDATEIPVKLKKAGEFEWATHIEDRIPKFKIHRTLGHAHAAITNKTYVYQGPPITISADLVLYHLEFKEDGMGAWVPQLQFSRGTKITHFPWQKQPPTPEEQRQEHAYNRVLNDFHSLIDTAERSLSGDVRANVVAQLRATRSSVLKLIRDS